MSSKNIFPWSRQRSNLETYYKTGGLLPINLAEADNHGLLQEKTATKPALPQPLRLQIIPPEKLNKQSGPSVVVAPSYGATLASNLHAALNNVMRSPLAPVNACTHSATTANPPAAHWQANPAPAPAAFVAELPGSLLQVNQGYPHLSPLALNPPTPTLEVAPHHAAAPKRSLTDHHAPLRSVQRDTLSHAKSVPNLGARRSILRLTSNDAPLFLLKSSNTIPSNMQERDRSVMHSSRRSSQSYRTNSSTSSGRSSAAAYRDSYEASHQTSVEPDTPLSAHGAPQTRCHSYRRQQDSPDVDRMKSKFNPPRRQDTASSALLLDLNQYKQNNDALQKQVELLMAKLSDSRKNEKLLRSSLERADQRCNQLQEDVSRAVKATKNVQALQNTINHLENRLEMANTERVDAQEQLLNARAQKSPFDIPLRSVQLQSATNEAHKADGPAISIPRSAFTSYRSSLNRDSALSPTKVSAAQIEHLQEEIKKKDVHISRLELDHEQLKMHHHLLKKDHEDIAAKLEEQIKLVERSQSNEACIEELKSAITDREATIGEKEMSVRAVERHLEHHRLLLQAEIRRHAVLKIHDAVENEPLPELTSLAAKDDIDRWITKLKQRLKNEQASGRSGRACDTYEAQVSSLQEEIDFYIREIIYFKLDIKGYKSDIRKLEKATAQSIEEGTKEGIESEGLPSADSHSHEFLNTLTVEMSSFDSFAADLGKAVSDITSKYSPLPSSARSSLRYSRDMSVNPRKKRLSCQSNRSSGVATERPTSQAVVNTADQSRNRPSIVSVSQPLSERRKSQQSTSAAPIGHVPSWLIIPPLSHLDDTRPSIPSTDTRPEAALGPSAEPLTSDVQARISEEQLPRSRYSQPEPSPTINAMVNMAVHNPNRDSLPDPRLLPAKPQEKSLRQRRHSTPLFVRTEMPVGTEKVTELTTAFFSPISPTTIRSRASSNASSVGGFPMQFMAPLSLGIHIAAASHAPAAISKTLTLDSGSSYQRTRIPVLSPAIATGTFDMAPWISKAFGDGILASSLPTSASVKSRFSLSAPYPQEPPLKPTSTKPVSVMAGR